MSGPGVLHGRRGLVCVALIVCGGCLRVGAQAAAVPSMQVSSAEGDTQRGRELLDAMVAALGGDAWLHRQTWIVYGRAAKFYKGQPDAVADQFEEYGRMSPFGLRVVTVAHYGALIATDHRDVAEVWTGDRGYELTYKGTSTMSAKDFAEFERRRKHSLDVVVKDWLKEKDAAVTDMGSRLADSELVDEVNVMTADGDAVTVKLDEGTHLPAGVSYRWRDPEYKDWNTDTVEFADYHEVQGIMTPYSVTMTHNGDKTGERFVTKVRYNVPLAADVFDPNKALGKNGK